MTAGYERAIKLTERIHVDDYYTDGVVLGQIYKVARLGHIMVEVLEKGRRRRPSAATGSTPSGPIGGSCSALVQMRDSSHSCPPSGGRTGTLGGSPV